MIKNPVMFAAALLQHKTKNKSRTFMEGGAGLTKEKREAKMTSNADFWIPAFYRGCAV